jgi:hypothetical protein
MVRFLGSMNDIKLQTLEDICVKGFQLDVLTIWNLGRKWCYRGDPGRTNVLVLEIKRPVDWSISPQAIPTVVRETSVGVISIDANEKATLNYSASNGVVWHQINGISNVMAAINHNDNTPTTQGESHQGAVKVSRDRINLSVGKSGQRLYEYTAFNGNRTADCGYPCGYLTPERVVVLSLISTG